MKNQRRIAIITGISLVLMAIFGIFSLGYAYTQFDNPKQSEFLKDIILANIGLYQSMLFGILIIIILDFTVSYSLYKYFEKDNKTMSLLSGIIRVIYTLIFVIATYYLTKNLNTNELTNQTVTYNYQQFQTIWNSGLVIFGFHIILIGWLMKLHRKIPKILWSITLLAGVSYMITSFLKVVSPDSELVETLIMILALPMTIGELGLAIWLWIKGGKETTIKNSEL